MIASTAAQRQAAGLIDLAADGKLDQHARGLIEVARMNPVRAAELITVLAETAAILQGAGPTPTGVSPMTAYLRRAHAAYARGEDAPWVLTGEREYQRLKKQSQRARTRSAAPLRAAS